MTRFKTSILMTAVATFAFAATPSFAQDADMMKDKAMDMAKDKVKSKAQDMATDAAGDMAGEAAGKGVDMGADMMKGKSAKDAAMDAVMDSGKSSMKSETGLGDMGATILGTGTAADMGADAIGSMSTEEKMKAGKIMLNGGSAEEAATAVAKDRMKDKAEDMLMDKASSMMSGGVGNGAAVETPSTPMAPMAAPAPAVTINCPSGTTAQPNGTCMITGDYEG